jgi:nucleoside phosphorylase
MCEVLGGALARRRWQLLLLSDAEKHADPHVLRGYCAEAAKVGLKGLPPVLLSFGSSNDPENQSAKKFENLRNQYSQLTFEDFKTVSDYPFNRVSAVRRVDAVVALGGDKGVQQLIEIADALGVPLVPIEAFGGVAERAYWQSRRNLDPLGKLTGCLTAYYAHVAPARGDDTLTVAYELIKRRHTYRTDMVVLTAVGVETEQLKLAFEGMGQQRADDPYLRADVNGLSVVVVQQNQMGMPAAAATAMQAIHEFRPRFMGMTGILGGVEGKVNLGDLVVPDPSWDYGSGKIVSGGEAGDGFLLEIRQERLDRDVLAAVRILGDDAVRMQEILERFRATNDGSSCHMCPPHPPKVVVGATASGAAVVASAAKVEWIREVQDRKLTGIEMEFYGLMCAARLCSEPRPTVLAVKGVSDFASQSKNDEFHRYAAFASALFLRYLFLKLSGRYW